ncbi:MAG: hypothetical protein LBG27_12230 [Spirochaetaceae bacterium]|nr:hypothetical protein [Spirochaetaceae bacterium]
MEFAELVSVRQSLVRQENPNMERKLVLEKAIADAVTYSRIHGILKDFFETLLPEEVKMLAKEWDMDEALRVREEEVRKAE